MTEEEWLTSTDPETMIQFVSPYTSRRKERLFAVACCRRLGDLLDLYCCELLTRIEASAEQPLSVAEREELINDAMAHADFLSYKMGTPIGSARWQAANAVWAAAEGHHWRVIDESADAVTTSRLDPETYDVSVPGPPTVGDPIELAAQADLLRHIVGNPFRPVAFDPDWRTEHVVGIAAKMIEEQNFTTMPILADALEEAGCDSAEILDHCRDSETHVPGCWAIDLVLGKQ